MQKPTVNKQKAREVAKISVISSVNTIAIILAAGALARNKTFVKAIKKVSK